MYVILEINLFESEAFMIKNPENTTWKQKNHACGFHQWDSVRPNYFLFFFSPVRQSWQQVPDNHNTSKQFSNWFDQRTKKSSKFYFSKLPLHI